MNVVNYCEFLERIGHHVVKSESGYWYDPGPRMFERIPAFSLTCPSDHEARNLFWRTGMLGIKYYADLDHPGKESFLYVCDDPDYDISNLGRSTRRKVRTGLRKCQVRQIDFVCLHAQGIAANLDTMERQKRQEPLFGDPEHWKEFCQAGGQVEGAVAWGAFVGQDLAAYTMGFIVDDYAIFIYQMSRSEHRSLFVNHALTYTATHEVLARPDIRCASQGHETVRNVSGLDDFKVRLGYKKRPLRQVFRFHPLVKPAVLNPVSQMALGKLRHWRPDSDALVRASGIVDIAQQSYQVH
jgi:hypothetical protein